MAGSTDNKKGLIPRFGISPELIYNLSPEKG
jgi:hypothetical protein